MASDLETIFRGSLPPENDSEFTRLLRLMEKMLDREQPKTAEEFDQQAIPVRLPWMPLGGP